MWRMTAWHKMIDPCSLTIGSRKWGGGKPTSYVAVPHGSSGAFSCCGYIASAPCGVSIGWFVRVYYHDFDH
ncbi:hypothetical protein BDZ94DRAFT_1261592 [Collybia nuda]|uniref:Uncharacterized protein n=1 Tax=Collybia nuda TaxID=64659 RepID=A0A9P5Y438_9AGAR|nr:hypothetical protein BDZ94DRAFT_1261592 [Collybia nuda]